MIDKCTKCTTAKLCEDCYKTAYEKLLEWLNSEEFKKEYGKRNSS